MADATYLTFAGFVQFDVKNRETQNGGLREATIRLTNHPEGRLINVALWDNAFSDLDVEKGDLLFVDGKFSSRVVDKDDGTTNTYYNVSATNAVVVKGNKQTGGEKPSGDRQTANKKADTNKSAF